jgi:hypothetical protein
VKDYGFTTRMVGLKMVGGSVMEILDKTKTIREA